MKMKILAPAGDFESLKMAVFNGADEVYLGVKDFNARNIEGFSLETLKQAVDFAHIFNVKVNLAVNILFTDEEMQKALDLIVDAFNLGVDSFIIQDIGLMSLIYDNYPQIEIHASTQMGIHNLEGVKQVEKFGVKRVVLARETPIEEIKRIKNNSNVEIEYFCQGALCVSFSGNCYMSSYVSNASGNRGKCKQLCRLPYKLRYKNEEIKSGYLLSAKDINMLENLNDLQKAGVDVLKIEGRARRAYYVGVATKIYSLAIKNESFNLQELMLAFNRGYTAGYLNGNGEIISLKQNHVGINVGVVERFKTGKKFNEIFITSNLEISKKSTLKFIKDNDEKVLTAYDISKIDNGYKITTTQKVETGSQVYLISDYDKEQEMLQSKKRNKVSVKIIAKTNKPITAEFVVNEKGYKVCGEICAQSKNKPITESELKNNFNKSELFDADLSFEMENIFLPRQLLNEFRRQTFKRIEETLTEIKNKKIEKIAIKSLQINKEFTNFQEISNLNEKFIADNIVYCPSEYKLEDVEQFKNKCETLNKKPYLNLPIFAINEDIKMLKNIILKTNVAVVVNNLYALDFDAEKIIGGGLNVYNSYSQKYYNLPYIQAEGGNYKMPYMTMLHCPMKNHMNANCFNCPYKEGYVYHMENGKAFKLKRIKMSNCQFQLID